jgi:uncharacterized membrane protein required for colicin V production
MSPLLIDIIFVACAIIAIVHGYRKGLVGQVVWFFSAFVGFGLAARFAADIAELLQYKIVSKPITIAVCFLVLFLAVIWLAHRIGVWITDLLKKSVVGTVNAALGAIFNLGLFLVIASLITLLAMLVVPQARETIQQTTVLQSVFEPVKAFLDDRILHHNEHDATAEP